jgi:hypothetical protein
MKNYVSNLFIFSALNLLNPFFCKVQKLIRAKYFCTPKYINTIHDININCDKYEILLK